MWTDSHHKQIMEYLVDTSVQLILVYIDSRNGLTLAKAVPPYQLEEIAYFIKPQNVEITETNFYSVLQMGTVKGNFVDSLLRAMHDLYAPTFFESSTWPDSIFEYSYMFTWLYSAPLIVATLDHSLLGWPQISLLYPSSIVCAGFQQVN